MKRKFNLIELVVSIIVLGIILAIIVFNLYYNKKEAVRVSVLSNTKLIQEAVDTHFVKGKTTYPTIGDQQPTLNNPILIDVNLLVEEGLLKKELDLSKIKNQHYWVDVFGKVWGATSKDIHSINLYELEGKSSLEFILGRKATGYKLYETFGYGNFPKDQLSASNNSKGNNKKYKEIGDVEINSSKESLINIDLPNKDHTYLISVLDEYGLETAPFGKFSSNSDLGFNPIINKTGVYEFEINSEDIMYWINFKYVIETPGETSVSFDFRVKDSKGEYEEWNKDFFDLPPSKHITIRVDMKGDSKGNKPSLLDLEVRFKHKDDDLKTPPVSIPINKKDTCPSSSITSDFSRLSISKGKGTIAYDFYIEEGSFFEKSNAPKIDIVTGVSYSIDNIKYLVSLDNQNYIPYESNMKISGKCMIVVYEITILEVPPAEVIDKICDITLSCYPNYCIEYSNCSIPTTCEILNNCTQPPTCMEADCPKTCIELNNCIKFDEDKICGSGATRSTPLGGSVIKIVYPYILGKDESVSKIDINNNAKGYVLKSIYVEYSFGGEPYVKAKSLSEIPKGSCFNVVYEMTKVLGYCSDCNYTKPTPEPPIIETCGEDCPVICKEECTPPNIEDSSGIKIPDWCDYNDCSSKPTCVPYQSECVPPVCVDNCSFYPPTDPPNGDIELNDKEWTTVDTVRFFGHGAQDQLTRWYRAEHSDSISKELNVNEISLSEDGKTRVVYRYAKSNYYYWSNEYKDFSETGLAKSVLGVAYIQVKTAELKNMMETEYPTVLLMRFYNEKGYLDASMTQPTLTIIPIKDNNKNREVFSDKSNVYWEYMAADPRNKKITDIEWGGDIRNQYPVGTYNIKARVKNEVEIWSEWVSFELNVLQEKPIAVIDYTRVKNGKEYIYSWNINKSNDPDGDNIVAFEFKNAYSTYTFGSHLVEARVKDSEGYWSDWSRFELEVIDEGFKLYRLEAEAAVDNDKQLDSYIVRRESIPEFSGGYGLTYGSNPYGTVTFTFEGTGFDFYTKTRTSNTVGYQLNDGPIVQVPVGHYSLRGLKHQVHTLKIHLVTNYLDYVDVYSSNDKVNYLNVKTRIINGEVEGSNEYSTFSTQLKQQVRHYYEVDKDSNEKITIISENGSLVRNISHKNILGGTSRDYSVVWDGKDNKGQDVPNGKYFINIELVGVNGTKSVYKKEVFVLNEKPIYRLEAEAALDNDKQITHYIVRRELIPEFSGGYGLTYNTNSGGNVTFTFEGTGFDFYTKIRSSGNVRYQLDNGPIVQVPIGLYSLRDLNHQVHTLKIYLSNNYLDYVDVYSNDDKANYLNVKTRILNVDVEGFTEDNTFSTRLKQQVKHYYEVDKDSNEKITITSDNGSLIRNISHKNILGGTSRNHSVTWDGKDNKGQEVSSGRYFINIELTGVNGTKSLYKKEVFVSNEKPSYRLEGENPSSNVVYYIARKEPIAEFSGGYGVTYNSSATGFVTFTFEGTGFDFYTKVRSGSKVRYQLDNGPIVQVPFGLYSLRYLNNQVHILKIYLDSNYLDYVDVYSNNLNK